MRKCQEKKYIYIHKSETINRRRMTEEKVVVE